RHPRPADPAVDEPREEMDRTGRDRLTPTVAGRVALAHPGEPLLDRLPRLVIDDGELGTLGTDDLGRIPLSRPPLVRPWRLDPLGLVERPDPAISLVGEHRADRRMRPTARPVLGVRARG